MLSITLGSNIYHQTNATIIKNVSRHAFINGESNNDMIDYHVLVIGWAAISLSFVKCISSTGIGLNLLQLLTDYNVQMLGVAPMRRNLITRFAATR